MWRIRVPRKARPTWERWGAAGFLTLLHVLPVVALVVYRGGSGADWLAFAFLYLWGALAMGVGLHRYFAHRSFETSRAFQFFLGLSAATTFTDPVSFGGKHRLHHKYSDTEEDVHSPAKGFWFCWFGHYTDEGYTKKQVQEMARDLMRYPELRWLHRWFMLPGLATAAAVYWIGGFSMLAIGLCLSRVAIVHASSAVNYICHRFGTRRYATRDYSRNNLFVAIISLGEGWHNNHHHYPAAARAGFYWWEIDPFYWAIRALSAVGLAWDVREVPEHIRSAPGSQPAMPVAP